MLGLCLLPMFFRAFLPAYAEEPKSCKEVFTILWRDKQNGNIKTEDFPEAIKHTLNPGTSPGCAAEYLNKVQSNVREAALKLFTPTRQSLFRALQNYSPQQQQGSTNSSSASVNPVSKPTGPSAVAEEFSGVNVNSSTSALTFQFAPGTLLSNLEKENVVVPCSTSLHIDRSCWTGSLEWLAESLTFSVTTNTSTTGQAIKGSATSPGSGGAVPATLSTAGSTEPSFGGFGTKIVAIRTKPNTKANKQANDTVVQSQIKFDQELSKGSVLLTSQLLNCTAYAGASQKAVDALSVQTSEGSFLQTLSDQYTSLGEAFFACLNTDPHLVKYLQDYLAAVLADAASEYDINAARKPLLAFEYDLNTPQNQPSYSSIKSNFSITFGKLAASKKGKYDETKGLCDTTNSKSILKPACDTAALAIAAGQGTSKGTANTSDKSGLLSNSKNHNTAVKCAAADNTKPFAINASVGADIYNAEPSSSIPSASRLRDIQAGVEIDWILRTSRLPGIGSLIGDSTLAGTYYYQDQTSPAILKGPPQTITISDLPANATQVYTSRGPIDLGQIRLGLGTGSNVSFPICFTYSNRSALIAHPIKGLQFGLSYNLSSIFTKKSQ